MRSPHALVITLLAAGLALTGCTGSSASDESSGTTAPTADASPVATATPVPADGPVAAFQAWWTAVRSADTVAACGALTEPLQQRMIAEYAATTGTEVGDCATLIRQSSALYAAAGLPADVTVEVESESADDALLQVTYANGDCGTVHLVRTTASWALTELSEECAG
jgi:ABC-type molybdate transport system substrate-binding protein